MIKIDVQADISRALEKLVFIRDEVSDKAIPRALNKIADQAKVQSAREIRDAGYKIKISEIKKALDRIKANKGRKVAVLKAIGRPLGLIHYDARAVKNGVTVSVKQGRKLIPHAFIATYKGTLGVYARTGGSSFRHKYIKDGKVIWSELPIKQLFGPSIPSMFMNNTVQDELLKLIRERFPDVLKHEIEYLSLKR